VCTTEQISGIAPSKMYACDGSARAKANAGLKASPQARLEIAGSLCSSRHEQSLVNTEIRCKAWGPAGVSACEEKETAMPLLQILITLVVVGVLLWLVNLIPMQGTIKSILNAVVVIAVVLWLLNIFGIFHSLSHIRVGA
jgi:hypothetical protein